MDCNFLILLGCGRHKEEYYNQLIIVG